jgi:hypothetical protein
MLDRELKKGSAELLILSLVEVRPRHKKERQTWRAPPGVFTPRTRASRIASEKCFLFYRCEQDLPAGRRLKIGS